MSRAVPLGLLLAALGAGSAAAQTFSIGGQGAFADYREVTASLHYRGTGYGGTASVGFHKLSGDVAVTRLSFDPVEGSSAGEGFKATQIDAWARWYVANYVSVEIGVLKRTADPDFAAQSVGAVRIGARGHYAIAPGADLSLRGNYLAGSDFSGGGRAPFAMEVALGVNVGTPNGRVRVTGDYSFQRLERKTNPGGSGEIKVPIQQAVARFGIELGF